MNQRDLQRLRRAKRTTDPVYVEWLDSMAYRGWVHRDDLHEHLPVMRSVGFVVGLTDEKVTLAGDIDTENGNVCGATDMPLFAITVVREVST